MGVLRSLRDLMWGAPLAPQAPKGVVMDAQGRPALSHEGTLVGTLRWLSDQTHLGEGLAPCYREGSAHARCCGAWLSLQGHAEFERLLTEAYGPLGNRRYPWTPEECYLLHLRLEACLFPEGQVGATIGLHDLGPEDLHGQQILPEFDVTLGEWWVSRGNTLPDIGWSHRTANPVVTLPRTPGGVIWDWGSFARSCPEEAWVNKEGLLLSDGVRQQLLAFFLGSAMAVKLRRLGLPSGP